MAETDPTLPCDDGAPNDSDGRVDFDPVTRADAPNFTAGTGDPGCENPTWPTESPQCNDGNNNDAAAGIDFDGGAGASLGGGLCAGPGIPFDCCTGFATGCSGSADPQCTGKPWKNREKKTVCGLGFELALVLVPLLGLSSRSRAMRA